MRYSMILAGATALATSVTAVPHAMGHNHAQFHEKRDVVVVTQYVTMTAQGPAPTAKPNPDKNAHPHAYEKAPAANPDKNAHPHHDANAPAAYADSADKVADGGSGGFITLPDGRVLPKDGPFTPRVTATGAEVVTLANGQKSISHLEQTLGLSTAASQATGAPIPDSEANVPAAAPMRFTSDPSGGPPTHDFEVIPNLPHQPGPNNRDYPGTILLQHNFHRKNQSADEVIWGFALQRIALDIANKCVYEHDLGQQGGGYGQSLAAGIPADNIGKVITDTFYNPQVQAFSGQLGKATPDMSGFDQWGFFTQMVWKATQQVGCYTVDCSSKGGLKGAPAGAGDDFTVCNYWPAGNIDGQYAANVGESIDWPSMQWDTDSWPPPGY